MTKLVDLIRAFFSGVARSKLSVVGAIISTVIFPVLLVSITLDMQGITKNPYFGFLIYMVMGPLFILGLLMVLGGVLFSKGTEDIGLFTFEYLMEQLNRPGRFIRIRKLIFLSSFLTIFTIFLVGLISYTGFHYTESITFCGQFCHDVMQPEFITHQNSPHSRVSCVECHIGEDAQWFTKAKISGARQLLATAFNSYERPIKTPVEGLRPVRDVCEECHRPEMFHGEKLYIKDLYLADKFNTHVQTVLLMKIGAGGYGGIKAHGIHWHVSPEHNITYTYTDPGRTKIVKVKFADDEDGSEVVFRRRGYVEKEGDLNSSREMDCMDCHNRPTHIYLSAEESLDLKIAEGQIPQEIPYIKRQGLEVIAREYATVAQARTSIAADLRKWYAANEPDFTDANTALLNKAISGICQAYEENVFPKMNVTWGTYKDFIGHDDEGGCFRCHDGQMVSDSGEVIRQDCNICHVVLANQEVSPEVIKILLGINK